MDVKKAAYEMVNLVGEALLPEEHPEFGRDHLLEMCHSIYSGSVTGEKAHRWLGWIQGCVCMGGGATLEELKDLNRKS